MESPQAYGITRQRVSLLRIDAIHHFVMISYGTLCRFHAATSCGFHTRLRRDLLRNPLLSPQFCGIMRTERRHRLHQHGKGKQMKVFLKLLDVIFTIVYVVWNLIEILAIPALFLIIGLLNSFPWQYYAATIGGYFIIAIVIQIICHFIFKHFEKKYESALMRLFERIFNKKS